MSIKVIIERQIIPGNDLVLNKLLMELRVKAMQAKGYISGETLRSMEDPNRYIVISTWESVEDWKAWAENEERMEIQAKVDAVLRVPASHHVYSYSGR
jgi:heme-degrading monooxygenase HmoA